MSASNELSAIYLTDTPEQIKNKVIYHAFSGGRATLEEHRRLGANLQVDIPYQYLRFFMEDDVRLEEIGNAYQSGQMSTSEIKKILISILVEKVERHKRARSLVTDSVVNAFMSVRKMCYTK
eukprot:TRINITY_DN1449_c0_g1_i5.p1 TRINITY_DN1449_c0_g1~~TRINITY_DN1449_c0_g1_i5.p1  ORF type:complete len:122 (+),score=25.30 TRINITY_DN1449_c0_g1_i5:654-1019(+)